MKTDKQLDLFYRVLVDFKIEFYLNLKKLKTPAGNFLQVIILEV